MFAIPLVPIYITGDDNQKVAAEVHEALRVAGYTVRTVASEAAEPDGAVLKGHVDKFWFSNYTWLFPFVPTWGDIEITLMLQSSTERSLWSHSFKGHGFSANFFNGYTSAAGKAMTTVLNEMISAFTSDEFRRGFETAAAES